jgi:hypothetical protein
MQRGLQCPVSRACWPWGGLLIVTVAPTPAVSTSPTSSRSMAGIAPQVGILGCGRQSDRHTRKITDLGFSSPRLAVEQGWWAPHDDRGRRTIQS